MKNTTRLHTRLIRVKQGEFEIRRQVSWTQFIGGLLLAGIFLIVTYFLLGLTPSNYLKFFDPTNSWEVEGWKLVVMVLEGDHVEGYRLDWSVLILGLYLFLAFLIKNFMTSKDGSTIYLSDQRKQVKVVIHGKPIVIPFSSISHIEIKEESEISDGSPGSVKLYFILLMLKDGTSYELFRVKRLKKKAEQIMQQLQDELNFSIHEGSSTKIAGTVKTKYAPKNEDKVQWGRKVRWYFWTNFLLAVLLVSRTCTFFFNALKDWIEASKEVNFVVLVHVFVFLIFFGLFAVVAYHLMKRAIGNASQKYELSFGSEGVSFFVIAAFSNNKSLVNTISYQDIAVVRQMEIKNEYFLGNVGIAILSKRDEQRYPSRSETFTSDFKHSIGIQLADDDYEESTRFEAFVEAKIKEKFPLFEERLFATADDH